MTSHLLGGERFSVGYRSDDISENPHFSGVNFPRMEAGVTDKLWSIEDVVGLMEL